MGRTELQDAVPMTVGQQFHGYAEALQWELDELHYAETALYGVNMGAHRDRHGHHRAEGLRRELRRSTSPSSPARRSYLRRDLIAGTWDLQEFVAYSSALKSLAIKLNEDRSDLILLLVRAAHGLFEINLPALQPGSSIMPGKVNPVMPELMSLIASA